MQPPPWLDRAAYPFQSRSIQLAAGRMHYVDEGSGDTLLLVHGTPTWSFEYRHLIKALSPRFRCVAPDHLGFGLSERPPGFAYTPEAHAANLSEFVERMRLDRFTLVVHDFGGPIGLPLALAPSSHVSALVLMNTWGWPFDDDPEMSKRARMVRGRVGAFLYRYLNASLRLLTPSAYGDRRRLTPAIHRQYLEVFRDRAARARVLHTLAKAMLDSREHYARILAGADRLRAYPALIVWGLKDSAFKPNQLARWRQLLPQAQVVELEHSGHWPHEEEPARVAEAIAGFLRTRR